VIIFAYGIVKGLLGKTFRTILRIFYQYRPRFHTETRRAGAIQERLEFDFIDLIQLMGQQDIFNLVSVDTNRELEAELSKTQRDYQERDAELGRAINRIAFLEEKLSVLESSRFWKLRNAWFKFKLFFRLVDPKYR